MSSELKNNIVSWASVILVILWFSISYDFITILLSKFSINIPAVDVSGRFYISKSILGPARQSFLVLFIRTIILIGIAKWSAHFLDNFYVVSIYIFYSFWAIIYLLLFCLSILKFPIPRRPSKFGLIIGTILIAIPLGSVIIGIIGVTKVLLSQKHSVTFTITEWRIAGLITVISIIMLFIIDVRSESPLLPVLINIRRKLGLRTMDAKSAIPQIDIVLTGIKANDILQEDVEKIFFNTEQARISLQFYSNEVHLINENIPKSTETLTDKQNTLLEAISRSLDHHLHQAFDAMNQSNEVNKKLEKRIQFLLGMSPDSSYDIQLLLGKIKEVIVDIQKKIVEAKEKYNQLPSIVKKHPAFSKIQLKDKNST